MGLGSNIAVFLYTSRLMALKTHILLLLSTVIAPANETPTGRLKFQTSTDRRVHVTTGKLVATKNGQ